MKPITQRQVLDAMGRVRALRIDNPPTTPSWYGGFNAGLDAAYAALIDAFTEEEA